MDFQRPAYVAAILSADISQDELVDTDASTGKRKQTYVLNGFNARGLPKVTKGTPSKVLLQCVLEKPGKRNDIMSVQVLGMHYNGNCLTHTVNPDLWEKLNPVR